MTSFGTQHSEHCQQFNNSVQQQSEHQGTLPNPERSEGSHNFQSITSHASIDHLSYTSCVNSIVSVIQLHETYSKEDDAPLSPNAP